VHAASERRWNAGTLRSEASAPRPHNPSTLARTARLGGKHKQASASNPGDGHTIPPRAVCGAFRRFAELRPANGRKKTAMAEQAEAAAETAVRTFTKLVILFTLF